jgi:hypothetical protein
MFALPRWPSHSGSACPPLRVHAAGLAAVNVVRRFGTRHRPRPVCRPVADPPHALPGNAVLAAHPGESSPPGLHELAGVLPQHRAFARVERLLGGQPQHDQRRSERSLRTLVRRHGQAMRPAEQTAGSAGLAREDRPTLRPPWLPAPPPRRRAVWPASLRAAVDQALQAASPRPPAGVSCADWERGRAVRRAEAACPREALGNREPEGGSDQMIVTTAAGLTRTPARRHFNAGHTARGRTRAGGRYLSGAGPTCASLWRVRMLVCAGTQRLVGLLAAAARWSGGVCVVRTDRHDHRPMILAWFHRRKRVSELARMICAGRTATAAWLRPVLRQVWHGQGEKANDLIVAKRQQGARRHGSIETSEALAALRTLLLPGGGIAIGSMARFSHCLQRNPGLIRANQFLRTSRHQGYCRLRTMSTCKYRLGTREI